MLGSAILAAVLGLAVFLYRKLRYQRLKRFAHLPQLPPSVIWGHLKVLNRLMSRYAPGADSDEAWADMAKELGRPPLMLVDLRPVFSWPMAIINNHDVAEQISRTSKLFPWSVPKSPTYALDLPHVVGKHSIILKQGEDWKATRKRFNPGFAHQHIMTLIPCILDKTWQFLQQLDRLAQTGDVFSLEDMATSLTFDIIGTVGMDVDFCAQSADPAGQNDIIRVYRELIGLFDGGAVSLWWLQPRREWAKARLSRRFEALLRDVVHEKFVAFKMQQSRSVLSLSLQGVDSLTDDLLTETCDQLKSFLFAGHDTTAIMLSWAFYDLSRTPHARRALKVELDDIFGQDADPGNVRDKLLSSEGEDLIGRMTYTSAIIKETLRLHPPGATARMAPPGSGFTVQTPDGGEVLLDGIILYQCLHVIQRDASVYGETAQDFLPERWLGDDTNPGEEKAQAQQQMPASAWRAFERGPRNCIGQELASIEARVILALAARRYDFVKVGLGALELDEKGSPMPDANGRYRVVSHLYNKRQVTPKPVDGMKMRVRLTPQASPSH